MIWGLVFGYMEGRRTSEVLGAILCASFIVSSGAVKSVGALLMQQLHVPVLWMPAATGLLFVPALLLGVWGLSRLPPPSPEDEAARVRRAPMTKQEMWSFLRDYGFGVTLLVITYVFATALRDFRDNFAPELWRALGYPNPAGVFTATELPVAVVALLALGVIFKVQDNVRALSVIHYVILGGLVLLGRLDAAVRCRCAASGRLDDRQRRRHVRRLHPVQRHAVRSPGGGQRPGGHGRLSDLCGRLRRLRRQLRCCCCGATSA